MGLLVLLGLAVGTMCWLGSWQLGVARDKGTSKAVLQAPKKPVAPLATVLSPGMDFPASASSRRVSVTGTYVASEQLLVPDRRLNGVTGYWVITPLQTEAGTIVVLRGFVTAPNLAGGPTTTEPVTVVGSLAPGESPGPSSLPAGEIGSVNLAELVNRWPGRLYNAFLFGISETPNATAAPIVRVPPPPPSPAQGFRFVNLMYAFQWWMFAGFAVYVFWRMLRDEVYGRPGAAAAAAPADNVTS